MKLSNFLNYLQYEKRYSAHTCLAYKTDLGQFVEYLNIHHNSLPIEEATNKHIRAWMAMLMQTTCISNSVHRKMASLRSFYKFLQIKGDIKQNPLVGIQLPKRKKRLPVFLEETATEKLFEPEEHIFKNDFIGTRDLCMLQLLYATGMRRAEIISLNLGDLDRRQGMLSVLGKGNKMRLIPLPPQMLELIDAYLEQRKLNFPNAETQSLFLTDNGNTMYEKFVYRKVKHYLSLVSNAEKRSPHVLRHTFATHLTNAGADLNAIKELLGHASLAATQIYTHNSISRLQEVYNQSHPDAQKQADKKD